MYLVSSQKSTLFLFLPLNHRKEKLWYNLFLLLHDAASFFFTLNIDNISTAAILSFGVPNNESYKGEL